MAYWYVIRCDICGKDLRENDDKPRTLTLANRREMLVDMAESQGWNIKDDNHVCKGCQSNLKAVG